MLTVRLQDEMEAEIERIASSEKKTKSDVIKDALRQYIASHRERTSSYELGADLFGVAESGETDRSVTFKKRIRDRLGEKHAH